MKSHFWKIISLAISLAFQAPVQAGVLKDHPGLWLGGMKIPEGPTVKIGAEIFTRADGSLWASVASPDQDAYDIPLQSVQEDGASVSLKHSVFSLTLTWDKDHFNGEWKQGDAPLKFELRQVAAFPVKARPQTPKGPFPYKDQTLAIAGADGVTLGATLSIPDGRTNPNVVVLVHGSGPGTRDLGVLGHKHFAVLADHLARRGVAVLRYDKRGNARSSGDYEQHTTAQLIDDLHAAVKAMKARKEFKRVGIIGLSEGPGLAAAVAARDPASVDFLVSMAGIGMNGLDTMLVQDRVVARDHGANPAEVERLMAYVRGFYDVLMAHDEAAPRIAALKAFQQGQADGVMALVKKFKMDGGSLSLDWAAKPFMIAALRSDPPADWRRVRSPVLLLNGSLDHQVPAKENLGGLVATLKAGGNSKVESQVLPSLNHLFQTAKTGKEDEYGKIDETIAPIALKRIAAFVVKQR
ncbi:MAG: alpha/beta fold hydrolase [Pseudomonadota bacterium]